MIDPRLPKYQWGQRVRGLIDLVNDGSFPNAPEDALLVGVGRRSARSSRSARMSRPTRRSTSSNSSEKYVIGCLEEEIEPA